MIWPTPALVTVPELLKVLEIAVLVFSAVGLLKFWRRTRFWLPVYVHILAGIGLVVGVLSVWSAPADTPVKRHGAAVQLLVALAPPAIIYGFFLLHGGQRMAYRRSFPQAPLCSACGAPRSDDANPCPRCGYAPQP